MWQARDIPRESNSPSLARSRRWLCNRHSTSTRWRLDWTAVAETTVRQLRPVSVESPARHSAAPSTAASTTASLVTTSFDTSLPASAVPPPPASVPPSLPPEPPVPGRVVIVSSAATSKHPCQTYGCQDDHTRGPCKAALNHALPSVKEFPLWNARETTRGWDRVSDIVRSFATIERTINDVEAFARHAALASAESAHNLPSHGTKRRALGHGRSRLGIAKCWGGPSLGEKSGDPPWQRSARLTKGEASGPNPPKE